MQEKSETSDKKSSEPVEKPIASKHWFLGIGIIAVLVALTGAGVYYLQRSSFIVPRGTDITKLS